MENERPTAMPQPLRRLAERLATAQDMADLGNLHTAFGYLEGAVELALAAYQDPPLTLTTAAAAVEEGERLAAYDAADVWRGVASHPLF